MSTLKDWSAINFQHDVLDPRTGRGVLNWILTHKLDQAYHWLSEAQRLLDLHKKDKFNPHRLHMPYLGNRILKELTTWLREQQDRIEDDGDTVTDFDQTSWTPDYQTLVDMCDRDPLIFLEILSNVKDTRHFAYLQEDDTGHYAQPHIPTCYHLYDPYPYKGCETNTYEIGTSNIREPDQFTCVFTLKEYIEDLTVTINHKFVLKDLPQTYGNTYLFNPLGYGYLKEDQGRILLDLKEDTTYWTCPLKKTLTISVRSKTYPQKTFDDFIQTLAIYPTIYNPIDIDGVLSLYAYGHDPHQV